MPCRAVAPASSDSNTLEQALRWIPVTNTGMTPPPSADTIIRLLGLQPHPEGGYFRETFRDTATDSTGRAASTAIYFLLREGEVSRWHRVDAAEAWHWYAGAPLALTMVDAAGRQKVKLGPDLVAGERPQAVVPAGAWQQAASLAAWTLVGCTVAPGFQFSGFELAPPGLEPTT
jgi:predicted cupin superfamily sugar epimerase